MNVSNVIIQRVTMLKIKLASWVGNYLYCEIADIHRIEGRTIFLRNMPLDHPGYEIDNEEMARIEPLLIGFPPDHPFTTGVLDLRNKPIANPTLPQSVIDACREWQKVTSYTGVSQDKIDHLASQVLSAVVLAMPELNT
jgi:hypothetical protein